MPNVVTGRGDIGLILMGGGARAAYQVGVLDAVREILDEAGWPALRNPYTVVCGTSAGALNAAALAAGCDDPGQAVRAMVQTWSTLHASDVYRTDARGALGNAAHWLGGLTMGWVVRSRPRSLFDNAPLAALLQRSFEPRRIAGHLERGILRALAITASSYTSGQHVTYFQSARPVATWVRMQRLACPATLTVEHLLASSAIPFVFPAVSLTLDGRREFFGDGSMRQLAPISPAIHLGADRILVIGAGQLEPGTPRSPHTGSQYVYPSLAQVAGHALAGIFLDGLAYDVERLTRINETLRLIAPEQRARSPLRPIEVLAITPSRRLDALAIGLGNALPRTVRTILRMTGATERRSAALLSYLLFEPVYTTRLIELGRADTLARRADVLSFFGLEAPALASPLAA
ncbi:MAG TPA: patatin-like phospholipase family protein [Burkholderiaceae bacterium]|jgi:NTE family protein|nr:patatin-like phospholipase family protein [Burkholderiaceae bacterium]